MNTDYHDVIVLGIHTFFIAVFVNFPFYRNRLWHQRIFTRRIASFARENCSPYWTRPIHRFSRFASHFCWSTVCQCPPICFPVFSFFRPDSTEPRKKEFKIDFNYRCIPAFGFFFKLDQVSSLYLLGKAISLLSHISLNNFTEFQAVDRTFIGYKGKLIPVPFSDAELEKSNFSKSKVRKLFMYVARYNHQDPSTQDGLKIKDMKFRDLLSHFKISADQCEFLGYGLSLASTEGFVFTSFKQTILSHTVTHSLFLAISMNLLPMWFDPSSWWWTQLLPPTANHISLPLWVTPLSTQPSHSSFQPPLLLPSLSLL